MCAHDYAREHRSAWNKPVGDGTRPWVWPTLALWTLDRFDRCTDRPIHAVLDRRPRAGISEPRVPFGAYPPSLKMVPRQAPVRSAAYHPRCGELRLARRGGIGTRPAFIALGGVRRRHMQVPFLGEKKRFAMKISAPSLVPPSRTLSESTASPTPALGGELAGLSEEEAARELQRRFGNDAEEKALIFSRDAVGNHLFSDAGRWRRIARLARELTPKTSGYA